MSRPARDGRLQDYLDGRLGPAERAAFEERLRADPLLARQVQDARSVREALRVDDALSPDFYARARRQFEQRHVHARPRFHHLLSWEAAGLGAAAVIALALFLPQLRREGAAPPPPVPVPTAAPVPPAAPSPPAAGLEQDAIAPMLDAPQEPAPPPPPAAEPKEELAAQGAPQAQAREDSAVRSEEPRRARQKAAEPRATADMEMEYAPVPAPEAHAEARVLARASATPARAVALPPGTIDPGEVRAIDEPAVWQQLLEGDAGSALAALGPPRPESRLVLVGAQEGLEDCAALEAVLVADDWEIRYSPAAARANVADRAGCALVLQQDGRAVRWIAP